MGPSVPGGEVGLVSRVVNEVQTEPGKQTIKSSIRLCFANENAEAGQGHT
jgi:hypothetical protein